MSQAAKPVAGRHLSRRRHPSLRANQRTPMPPSTPRSRSYASLRIATLTLIVFVFTVAAGAAPRTQAAKPIPAGSGTGLSAVYVDESGSSVSRVDAKIDFAW